MILNVARVACSMYLSLKKTDIKRIPQGEKLNLWSIASSQGGLDERDREDFWRTRSDLSIANKITFSNLRVPFRRENDEVDWILKPNIRKMMKEMSLWTANICSRILNEIFCELYVNLRRGKSDHHVPVIEFDDPDNLPSELQIRNHSQKVLSCWRILFSVEYRAVSRN
jgi:hypothetical protein